MNEAFRGGAIEKGKGESSFFPEKSIFLEMILRLEVFSRLPDSPGKILGISLILLL